MLGGVTVARMAKDPESLRGSSAKVAQLVEANGLLEAAIKEGSPSRQVVAQTIADAARGGEQVLCFAEYTSHLELLRSELAEVHDVEAGMFAGGAWKTERERTKARFRAGDLGVVLIGPVGQKGQNVQPAAEEAIALHYDLPWEPRRFEQRVGRAARPGSGADEIAVLVPILRDSIEEHVAEILLPRSARAIGALSRDREAEPLAVQLEAVARELASDEEASTQIAVCERIFRSHGSGALAAAA
jgi:superfamily II DNA/RNA helicase